MHHTEASTVREVASLVAGPTVGIVVGVTLTALLSEWSERSTVARLIGQFWVWSIGSTAGLWTALAIGGPYLFTPGLDRGPGLGWRLNEEPYPLDAAILVGVLFGLIGAFHAWRTPQTRWPRLRRRVARDLRRVKGQRIRKGTSAPWRARVLATLAAWGDRP